MHPLIVGIDVGRRGAIAVIDHRGWPVTHSAMPEARGFLALMRNGIGVPEPAKLRVYIEHAQAMPGQGVTSMFNYGCHFGGLLMALESIGCSPVLVRPYKWAAHLRGIYGDGGGNSPKEKSLAIFKKVFPTVDAVPPRCRKVHDGIVDAYLIAEYGRLMGAA